MAALLLFFPKLMWLHLEFICTLLFVRGTIKKKKRYKKNRFNEGIKDKFLYFKHYRKGKKKNRNWMNTARILGYIFFLIIKRTWAQQLYWIKKKNKINFSYKKKSQETKTRKHRKVNKVLIRGHCLKVIISGVLYSYIL